MMVLTSARDLPRHRPGGEIRALTGLRGLAALYVVLFHCNVAYPFPSGLIPFMRHGYIAVDLFFILSGFVMAMTAAPLFENGFTLANFKRFLSLRLARIYPLFALTTLLMAALMVTALRTTTDTVELGRQLFFNLTLTHAWGLAKPIVPPSWSIGTEWVAYLLFPLTLVPALKSRRTYALASLAIAFLILTTIAYGPVWLTEARHIQGETDVTTSFSSAPILRCLAGFHIGLVTFRFRGLMPPRAAGWLAAFALLLLWIQGTDIILIAVFSGLVMALSHDQGHVARTLQSRWMYGLGVISYALYLAHDLIMKIVFSLMAHLGLPLPFEACIAVAIALAASVSLAILYHYGFERPMRQRLRRLIEIAMPRTVPTIANSTPHDTRTEIM